MTDKEQLFLYKSIGDQIKILRNRSQISQEELAKRLDLSRASVVNIEKGRQHPSLHLLIDLARIFNVSVLDFLSNQFSETAVQSERISRLKKEITKVTTGDSIKLVSEFIDQVAQKKN